MPDWDQRVRDHAFSQTLSEINQELEQIGAPKSADENEHLERVRRVVGRLNSLVQDADSDLLSQTATAIRTPATATGPKSTASTRSYTACVYRLPTRPPNSVLDAVRIAWRSRSTRRGGS